MHVWACVMDLRNERECLCDVRLSGNMHTPDKTLEIA